jgi:hypothetical protein
VEGRASLVACPERCQTVQPGARLSVAAAAAAVSHKLWSPRAAGDALAATTPLTEVGYGDVTVSSALHEAQLKNTHDVLMDLNEDSLLKPFRQMASQAAPGPDLGGWYNYDPNLDWHKDDAGLPPVQLSDSGFPRWPATTQSPGRRRHEQWKHAAHDWLCRRSCDFYGASSADGWSE